MISGRQVLTWAASERNRIGEEVGRIDAAAARHDAELAKVQASREEAWRQLVDELLPSLAPDALAAAAARAKLTSLSPDEIARRADERFRQVSAELAQIERDPLFVNAAPRLNAIEIRLQGLADHIGPLQDARAVLESEEHFSRLVHCNYGTPSYDKRFWHVSYYSDWKHGDLLVEKHGPRLSAQDFAGLRARYITEREALETLLAERRDLEEQRHRIQEISTRQRDLRTALSSIEAWSLSNARARLREHLSTLEDKDRLGLFADAPTLALAAKRASGLDAKERYLGAIRDEWLIAARADVARSADKLDRFATKLSSSRRKLDSLHDLDEVRSKYGARTDRWNKRWDRYNTATQTIVVYDNYSVYDPWLGHLWWDVMTHGDVKGHFIPEVAHWHDLHGHHHDHPHDHDHVAGAVAHGHDDLIGVDAS